MKTTETSITENQFWQIVGLITAARHLNKQIDSLESAYREITGDEELNRFSDYVYEERDIIESLKDHLPSDKIIVTWNKMEKKP